MQNTPPKYAKKLYDIVSEVEDLPEDDYDHHEHLKPLKLSTLNRYVIRFETLLNDCFLEPSKGGRNKTDTDKLRKHWELILLNLSFVMFQRQWLLVPGDRNYYSKYWATKLGVGYRPTRAVVNWLLENDFIEIKEGKLYKENPKTIRVFPKPKLMELLWEFFLQIEQPIEPPYLEINESEAEWGRVVFNLEEDHPDKLDLTIINDFLKPHVWACKGPVKLIYKNNPFQGGRLYTPFQSLPDRRMRLRINTLIDGESLCEVDFSANHLRMNLAFNGGLDAGEDPYTSIGQEAGIIERNTVKKFITIAMGSDSQEKARGACFLKGLNTKQVSKLTEASQKVFPKLELFKGWGIYAQNLEGQILKNVMLEGAKEGVVCLPVHDAIAVPLKHQGWASDQMRYQWDKQLEVSELARVTTDLPD